MRSHRRIMGMTAPLPLLLLLCALLVVSPGRSDARTPSARDRAADYRVACLSFKTGDIGRVKPGTCFIQGLGFGDAGSWSARKLRWKAWGTSRAVASGINKTRSLTGGGAFSLRIAVVLTRPVTGCDGRKWYSRVRVGVRGGRPLTMRLPTCPGPRDWQS